MSTARYRGSHFATFPPTLIERPIKATCPEFVLPPCPGTAWKRHGGTAVPTCDCDGTAPAGRGPRPVHGIGAFTAVVAERLRRDWLGIELNPEYRKLALQRIEADRTRREEVMKKTRRNEP